MPPSAKLFCGVAVETTDVGTVEGNGQQIHVKHRCSEKTKQRGSECNPVDHGSDDMSKHY